MRQRRTALKHVLSGNACKALLVSPSHHSRSVRDQSRMEPTQPTIPALVSPDGGDLFGQLFVC